MCMCAKNYKKRDRFDEDTCSAKIKMQFSASHGTTIHRGWAKQNTTPNY